MQNIISEKIHALCHEFHSEQLSVETFQYRLEPLLHSFPCDTVPEQTRELFHQIINKLEIVIYTLPVVKQKDAVEQVISDLQHILTDL